MVQNEHKVMVNVENVKSDGAFFSACIVVHCLILTL
jgi:hypothetical protein